jgi:TRAP-type C4-dicarboxylate transport system permease small subunit
VKVIKSLDKYFEEVLMGISLLTIVVLMTLQVIMRYLFNHALSFPEEICRYSFIWLCYLGVSYAVKAGGTLKVDILYVIFPKMQNFLSVLSDAAYVLFSAALLIPGIRVIQTMMELHSKSAAVGLPLWIIYVSLFLGCALTVIRMIEKYVGIAKERREKSKRREDL